MCQAMERREQKALAAQQEAVDRHNDWVDRERKRVAAYNAKVERDNGGIRHRNQNGASIPLRVPLAMPLDEPIALDLREELASIAQFEKSDLTFEDMFKELGPLAAAAGAGEGRWQLIYDVGYRALSGTGGRPTLMVLNSYFDVAARHVTPRTNLPTLDVACIGGGIFLTSLLAEHVLEGVGLDVSVLRAITERYRDSPLGEGDV